MSHIDKTIIKAMDELETETITYASTNDSIEKSLYRLIDLAAIQAINTNLDLDITDNSRKATSDIIAETITYIIYHEVIK